MGVPRGTVFEEKMQRLTEGKDLMASLQLTPKEAESHGLRVSQDGVRRNASEFLSYPDIDFNRLLEIWPQLNAIESDVREQLEIDATYAGYLDRQQQDIAAFKRDERLRIPADLDYGEIGGLSNEVKNRLMASRPETLGQASRLEGVTPGAIAALLPHVKRPKKTAAGD